MVFLNVSILKSIPLIAIAAGIARAPNVPINAVLMCFIEIFPFYFVGLCKLRERLNARKNLRNGYHEGMI